MAVSTCVKCGGHGFELASLTPIGQQLKLTDIQCSNCGTPVGALDPTIEALATLTTMQANSRFDIFFNRHSTMRG